MAHNHGHDHGHAGHHHHNHGSVSKHNEEKFDELAPQFEAIPWIVKIGEQTTQELHDHLEWIGVPASGDKTGKLFDYACGSGVVARALAPNFGFSLGVDLSYGMIKQFNRIAEREGYTTDKMKGIRANLLDPEGTPAPELDDPNYFDFDLATLGFALHHVEDPEEMLRKLAERVRPGGSVLIIDLVGTNRQDLPDAKYVTFGGFTEEAMKEYFQKVGLVDFGWKLFKEPIEMPETKGGPKQPFMARAVKPLPGKSEL